MSRQPAPPSGHPPPERARLEDGTELNLRDLAAEICRRYREAYPDEEGRYGDAGVAWCLHDNQHLLNWAVLDVRGDTSLVAQVSWLAGVLEARAFPLDRLAHDLDLAADVLGQHAPSAPPEMTAVLRRAARHVRDTDTFL